MEDIELVIKIPEEMYQKIKETSMIISGRRSGKIFGSILFNAILTGTPLPKNHGVLKDVTNLMRGLYTDMQTVEETFTSSEVYKMIDEECSTIIDPYKKESDS